MDENQMDENRIRRKALDQNPLDEKVLYENWAHVNNNKERKTLKEHFFQKRVCV